jgi:hypothetical protein
MAVLLLTYDLNREPDKTNYEGFYKVRDDYDYVKLSESSYALNTLETPAQVYARLEPHMDTNDSVYVINLKRPYSGVGLKDVNDWLQRNLPS